MKKRKCYEYENAGTGEKSNVKDGGPTYGKRCVECK